MHVENIQTLQVRQQILASVISPFVLKMWLFCFGFFFPLWLDMVIPHLPFSLSMVETSLISFVSLVLQLLFCLGFYPFVLYRKYQLFPCDRIYIIKAASFNSVYCLCENIARISIFCILMVQGFFICLFLLF